jgi:predicted cupin superfamily sugar epimerase
MEKSIDQLSAKEVIDRFRLTTVERQGGFWAPLERNEFGNADLYLITEMDHCAWHKLNEAKNWFHFAGSPVTLHTVTKNKYESHNLDRDSEGINYSVNPGDWMAAESTGRWSLMICNISPAYTGVDFATAEDFEKLMKSDSTLTSLQYLISY